MSAVARLIIATLLGAGGIWLVVTGLAQRRPVLSKMSTYLARRPLSAAAGPLDGWARLGRPLARRFRLRSEVLADLRLVHRTTEVHAAYIAAAAASGLFGPALFLAIGQMFGVLSIGAVVLLVVTLCCVIAAPLLMHSSMRSSAAEQRIDLRYQLSSYLDVVTMLLAGNVGNEGALRQAAQAGDGRLFVELRTRILVAETSNRSLVAALAQLGDDLELVELQQISASASLAASAGAPVAKSLAAKCATLRNALSAEQEADARVRTGKITVPLVGMSLLIMASVIYPALNFSR
jgi:Flp pilus assembly protein TadB